MSNSQKALSTSIRCGERTGECTVQIFERTDGERMGRAALIGIFGLIITAASALIPIVHFISVPVGLLGTLVVTGMAFGAKKVILEGSGNCPMCGGAVKIYKRAFKLPFTDTCDACHRAVVVGEAAIQTA